MFRSRKAKIVATIGPSSASPDVLRKLFAAGVDVFRLNFSHGIHADHEAVFHAIRAIEQEAGRPIGILQDLQCPKIRVGTIRDGKQAVALNEKLRFVPGMAEGGKDAIPLPHPEVFEAVMPGHELLIDDGRLRLRIEGFEGDAIVARAMNAGVISNRNGVNLPSTVLNLSPLTAKDLSDVEFGLKLGVDFVALSFVQKPSDMIEAQGLVQGCAHLVAKIEKPSALEQIEDIVRLSDAVMIARGDLGVEIPPEDVPRWQKKLVRLCRMTVKPVIVATQMLESMVSAPTPTRAEASDVATAVYDGADAVMLSAESASGAYPAEAVEIMARIISTTEKDLAYRPITDALAPDIEETPAHAIAAAAADIAHAVGAGAIVAFTAKGVTALRVARKRPDVPILAITPDPAVARRLCLLWGAGRVVSADATSYDDMITIARACSSEALDSSPTRPVVIVSGIPFAMSGGTNNIRVI